MTQAAAPKPATKVRRGIFRRSALSWLFSPQHFHFKLLSGTAVGIVVIAFLAGLFLFVTLRNHRDESLRTHTIKIMRLGSVIANDIAALETSYRGFILTGGDIPREAWPLTRAPLPFETSMPGAFATGDIRHGSVKRVAGAVGEGSVTVGSVHQYLTELQR